MNDRIRLPLQFDAALMQKDLLRLAASEWIPHFVTQNYDGDWSVIPLRGPRHATHPVMMIYSDPSCTDFAETPFLKNTSYLPQVLNSLKCTVLAARLMKLSAGSEIREHTDHDLSAEEGNARLHIPVKTNDDVDFRLNGSRVVMQEGECWYLRLSDPHSVTNHGTTDRVHLVIDLRVNDWLTGMLQVPGPAGSTIDSSPAVRDAAC